MLERPKDKPLVFGRDFPIGHMFVFWKGDPMASDAKSVTLYERGKPVPIKQSLGIMALFGFTDDFVRVYAIPIDAGDKSLLGPARVTLSRTASVPSLFFEYMSYDQLISEVANEVADYLSGADVEDDDDDDEEEDEDGGGFTPT